MVIHPTRLIAELLALMLPRWTLVCLIALLGCLQSAPAKPPAPPIKDLVKVEPGPVDPDAPEEFTTTASGLQYRIRRKSDGKMPTENDAVRVHYRGRFNNAEGQIFDSSYGKTGRSVEFNVTGVIKGWTEGLLLTGEGGMIELIIPPEIAYGKYGMPPQMPPNATLHFIVEVIEVKPATVPLPALPQPANTNPSHP